MEIPLLTKGESKVYQTLVELGESSIGNVIKMSGVSHSKIYDILKRLSEKGLVSSINKNGKQYFSAADPSRISELIEEEKTKLETAKVKVDEVVKQLKARKKISKPTSILSSFEGVKGMKSVLEYILERLKKGEEVLILGAPRQIDEQVGGYLKDWQKRRIKIGIICKIITDIDSPSWDDIWWEQSKNKKLTFTKKSGSISPAYLLITNNSVTTIYFSTTILTFIIEHPDIANRYREFFIELWNQETNKHSKSS